jgi:hypothetical protein
MNSPFRAGQSGSLPLLDRVLPPPSPLSCGSLNIRSENDKRFDFTSKDDANRAMDRCTKARPRRWRAPEGPAATRAMCRCLPQEVVGTTAVSVVVGTTAVSVVFAVMGPSILGHYPFSFRTSLAVDVPLFRSRVVVPCVDGESWSMPMGSVEPAIANGGIQMGELVSWNREK